MQKVHQITLAALLVFMSLPSQGWATEEPLVVEHRVWVKLDPVTHEVTICDTLYSAAPLDTIQLGYNFEFLLTEYIVDGQPAGQTLYDASVGAEIDLEQDGYNEFDVQTLLGTNTADAYVLHYSGKLFEPVDEVSFSRENVGGEIEATVGEEGVYLSARSRWLPIIPGAMATHHLTVDTPADFEPITQGVRVSQRELGSRLITVWHAEHPSDGLNLVAGRYHISEDLAGETAIYTYLLDEDQKLSDLYLERTKVYLAMYEEMLGPYPYGKFATVENWFPTGYGMPSYTLLGGVVMRLPFIPYTSFGHEICHNWWGNSIFVGEGGNWCEGLTSYCADYSYKLQESSEAAREYRRNLLKDYAAYVKDSARDFPLVEFESRHSGATRAVGYGKSMMVFHMLERLIGREPFLVALRQIYADHQFQQVGWDHFFTAFTSSSGQDLTRFQEQWLTRTGAVFIQLERAEREGDTIQVKLRQGMPAYDIQVPVVVTTPDGELEQIVQLRKHIDTFQLEAPGATEVRIDPDYQLFRKLHPEEIEPTLNQVLAEEVPLFILPAGNEAEVAAARQFAVEYTGIESPTVFENGQPPVDIRPGTATSFILINPPTAELTPRLQPAVNVVGDLIFIDGARYNLNEYDLVLTATNPHDPTVTDMVVICRNPVRLPSLASRVGHYGKYSWLLFPAGQGRAIRGNWLPAGNPLSAVLAP